MKIRNGFVSNSSSSSFMVSFVGVPLEVRRRLRDWCHEHRRIADDGYPYDGENGVFGSCSYHFPEAWSKSNPDNKEILGTEDEQYLTDETMGIIELARSLGVPEENMDHGC